MKALIVTKPNDVRLLDIPRAEPGPYDVLVKIDVCGVCNSTDAKLIEGTMFWAPPFPIALGHESAGRVVGVGPKVRKFKVGDLVTRPLAFWPGARKDLNVAMGGMSEYGIVRDGAAMAADGDASLLNDYNVQRQLVVPPHLNAVQAALTISLAETASVFIDLPNIRGKTVLVAGTGLAGIAFGLWAKLGGAQVIALGRRDERLAKSREFGADITLNTRHADWPKQLPKLAPAIDGAIEATGDAALAKQLVPLLSPGAFAVAYGVPPTGINYDPRWKSANVQEHLSFYWVASLIERGWIKPEWFISEVVKLNDAISLIGRVKSGQVLKGFIEMGAA